MQKVEKNQKFHFQPMQIQTKSGGIGISKIDEGPMVRRCRTGYGGQ